MAIRLEHQPVGISGLAAYAAGAGRKRERDLKYGIQLAQQGQARRDKYNLQANQQAFSLQRDADQRQFTLDRDEIRDAFTLDREKDRERWHTEREERGHKRDDFEHERDIERDDFEHGRSVHAERVERGLEALAIPTPEGVPKELLEKIDANRKAMRKFTDGTFDLDDKESGPAFEEAYRKHQKYLSLIPEKSNQDKASENIVTYGGSTYQFINGKLELLPKDEPAEQTVPFRGQLITVSEYEKFYDQSVKERDRYERRKEQFPDKDLGDPPKVLPPLRDILYPEQQVDGPSVQGLPPQQRGVAPPPPTPQQRAWGPVVSEAIKAARSDVPSEEREAARWALEIRGISWTEGQFGVGGSGGPPQKSEVSDADLETLFDPPK